MKIYLVQHGEACSKDTDPERPLTMKGREDIDRLALFLQRASIQVASIIHSGKLRAQQTAEQLIGILAPGTGTEISSVINPNDDPEAFLAQYENREQDLLVVSHLPFVARLLSYLVTGDSSKQVAAYQPGTIVCLELMPDDRWQVSWMIRPELLV